MLSKVLVANRGEIAVRVIRTCRELGIATVAVHSEVDRGALHVRLADEARELGGETAAESYLNLDAILHALESSGADGLHPGYGFLSEDPRLARAVAASGATFVGPRAESIEAMGDKVASRRVAKGAGVPVVPGTSEIQGPDEVVAFGNRHGWPVAIKAAFGGGGRGLKIVPGPEEAGPALESARREAQAWFGRPEVYVERFFPRARHVEVQVLADHSGRVAALPERDCSCQRRQQKLLEETPAPGLPEDHRRALADAAILVARACDYLNAGTVEFLYQEGEFAFLEMNTRLQVEHPVTEMVCGIDLVAEQLGIAAGEQLSVPPGGLPARGHALECRVNAEDAAGGAFRPAPGPITRFSLPGGYGVRVDAGYESGDAVNPHYDNLVAKVVAWGRDRDQSISRMARALAETVVEGVPTTIPAHLAILAHPDFRAARHTTRWVDEVLDLSYLTPSTPAVPAPPPTGPAPDAPPARELEVEVDGRRHRVRVWTPSPAPTSASPSGPGRAAGRRSRTPTSQPRSVTAPMIGRVLDVLVAVGDRVEPGDPVCVLEAMKMENRVDATAAGTVTEVRVSPGDTVGPGDVLVVID